MSKLNRIKSMAAPTTSTPTATVAPEWIAIHVPYEVAETYRTTVDMPLEAALTTAVTRFAPYAPDVKPIVLTDEQRRSIEKVLDVNIKNGQHLADEVARLTRIKLTGPLEEDEFGHQINIPGNVLERMYSRMLPGDTLSNFIEETILTLLRQFTRLH